MNFPLTSSIYWLAFLIANIILNANFVIIYVMLTCAKRKMATKPVSAASSGSGPPLPPSGSANSTTPTTSNTNNVKFADHDDPKNKSTYGVDDAMFKRKKVDPAHDKEKLKKDIEAEMSAAPSKEDYKKKSSRDVKEPSKKANNTTKTAKDKKKDDSDKTDLRSLTLERNLLEAKTQANQKKNPAGADRSMIVETPPANSPLADKDKSKYAVGPKPTAKPVSSPSNMPNNSQKQNRSAYLKDPDLKEGSGSKRPGSETSEPEAPKVKIRRRIRFRSLRKYGIGSGAGAGGSVEPGSVGEFTTLCVKFEEQYQKVT
uniref:G_PROTEIN_RECEP_F1_2 domain-containing protein n=1 Tax=Panagrellus redivivus TaxID=6233 RepID=A0A7E4VLJ4_PANRE